MDSRNIFLPIAFFAVISLGGCQNARISSISTSDTSHKIKPVTWEKTGELFYAPSNNNLAANESRVVFFHDSKENEQLRNIKIGMGADNRFHVSLQNGHYSDAVICSGSQTISVGTLNQESGKVISHSKSYQFIPQITTYFQVALSAAGSPVIEQVSVDKALVLLNGSAQQTHQISRVVSDCDVLTLNSTSPQQTIAITTADKQKIQHPAKFNLLFDFDSVGIKSNHSRVVDGMANFIQSYPQMSVTLQGHTDNKGPESYNLKLSESRANMVKNILVDQYGIEAIRINSIGYGETMPVDTNNTREGRQNNRRVVAIVSKETN